MWPVFGALLIVAVSFDVSGAAGPEGVDFNRLVVLKADESHKSSHSRRSISSQYPRSNDYDDHSSGFTNTHVPVHVREKPEHGKTAAEAATRSKIYQPKEDPRLFYQSEQYLQKTLEKNNPVNSEISAVYPNAVVHTPREYLYKEGHDDFRYETKQGRSSPFRMPKNYDRRGAMENAGSKRKACIKCPAERTLIAKPGVDRVMLQPPQVTSCAGGRVPRGARFQRLYGPTFGSLLEAGSHMIVGRVMLRGQQVQQLCKFQVHVVTQICPVPQYLHSKCEAQGQPCKFSCADPDLELHGQANQECGADLKWKGELPFCRARTWCSAPPPPEHGHVSCQGEPGGDGGLAEGSRCRARCARTWRPAPRAAVCRRGSWSHALACLPRHKTKRDAH